VRSPATFQPPRVAGISRSRHATLRDYCRRCLHGPGGSLPVQSTGTHDPGSRARGSRQVHFSSPSGNWTAWVTSRLRSSKYRLFAVNNSSAMPKRFLSGSNPERIAERCREEWSNSVVLPPPDSHVSSFRPVQRMRKVAASARSGCQSNWTNPSAYLSVTQRAQALAAFSRSRSGCSGKLLAALLG
jgi:hypothetical protein